MLTVVMRTIWPLFLGILFIGLGNGLQGTLSSWRADYEGFSVLTTGLVMSGYFHRSLCKLNDFTKTNKKDWANSNVCCLRIDRINSNPYANIIY